MKAQRTYGKVTWIDLAKPNAKEIQELMEDFSIHPQIAEELLQPSSHPKVDLSEGAFYGVFNFPALRGQNGRSHEEMDFVVGQEYIVTAHYEEHDPFHEFAKLFEVNAMIGSLGNPEHAGHIFLAMLKHLYRALHERTLALSRDLEWIETNIFSEKEKEMVFALSNASKNLLDLRNGLSMHKSMIDGCASSAALVFDRAFADELLLLHDDCDRVEHALRMNKEFLDELRTTNITLLSTKQSEIMKIFTVLTLVVFPVALVIDVLTIASPSNPILGKPHDFWIILGIVFAFGIALFLYYRSKRWI